MGFLFVIIINFLLYLLYDRWKIKVITNKKGYVITKEEEICSPYNKMLAKSITRNYYSASLKDNKKRCVFRIHILQAH